MAKEKEKPDIRDDITVKFISRRVSDLIKYGDFSARQLSEKIGRSKNYITNIIGGWSSPSITDLLLICKCFEISPKDFFDIEFSIKKALFAKKNEPAAKKSPNKPSQREAFDGCFQ
ncbi:MAG: helix-turn-helix domain-containing protein [Oscillospiraceae bacterium]|nr:helix-turn-helix domain-containing protein [Oscillospiraceae bacterium]